MRRALALLALGLCTCRGQTPAALDGPALLQAVKAALAERDRKVGSYRFSAQVEGPSPAAAYEVTYRAPNRLKVEVLRPVRRTYAFDGATLYERVEAGPAHRVPLPAEASRSALLLASVFNPFVPEGLRVPLFNREAKASWQPTAPGGGAVSVEVEVEAQDESGRPVRIRYLLRWPSADFLSKRVEGAHGSSSTEVREEACHPRLGLCHPTHLEESGPGRVQHTRLHGLVLEPTVPLDSFRLVGPAGP